MSDDALPGDRVRATLRSFNRSHTRRVGVLDDSFLATGRPLAQARLLFEIGLTGTSILVLRRRLGLDSGYLSRLLRSLEHDGLVIVDDDPDDGRRRVAHLTEDGRAAWRDLDRRSDRLAADLVEPLTDRQRAELAASLASADRLLRVATITFDVVDPRAGEALAAMGQYFAELHLRFTAGFDPADTLVADAPAMRPPSGSFVVARSGDDVVACGGMQRHDASTGEIKRMWVHADWRGLGLGRRTLDRLERSVIEAGYRRVILDTNSSLTEAISMYERSGYRPIERYNDNPYAMRWFEKRLDGSVGGPDLVPRDE